MKYVRHFDEVYEELMDKNKDHFAEILDSGKNKYSNDVGNLCAGCLLIAALFYFFFMSAIKEGNISLNVGGVILFIGKVLLICFFLIMLLYYYAKDNKTPDEVIRDVEDHFVKRIFTEIFPVYEYINCHEEISPELKDKVERIIGDSIINTFNDGITVEERLEEVRIIEKVTTIINNVPITILGVSLKYIAKGYGEYTHYNTYVMGKLKKDLAGTLKVIYDEENLPTGTDEFSDYYRVECNGIRKDDVLTPGVKEAFVNTRDEGKDLNLYMRDNEFIIDACPRFCISYYRSLVKGRKINQDWARERYGVYLHIYNAVDELTK